jgi:hypothetical protein
MEGDHFSVAVQIETRAFADPGPSNDDHVRFQMHAKELADG